MVAVNKMDKPTANPDRVLQELASLGLVPEDWGGDTVVSVRFPPRPAKASTKCSKCWPSRPTSSNSRPTRTSRLAATSWKPSSTRAAAQWRPCSSRNGTLHQGDTFVCGVFSGRVRAMFNDQGRKVKEAGPSIPVEVQGFEGVPEAGEDVHLP